MKIYSKRNSWAAIAAAICSIQISTAIGAELEERIQNARIFRNSIVWVGDKAPRPAESENLWLAVQTVYATNVDVGIRSLDQFVSSFPHAAWTPSLQVHLGDYHHRKGRFSRALEYWEAAWNATKRMESGRGKGVADEALARRSSLLASLGRVEALQSLFNETQRRNLDAGPWQQLFNSARDGFEVMKTRPEVSFRCGSYALHHIATELLSTNYDGSIADLASPERGFSMTELIEIARKHRIDVVPVRTAGSHYEIVVPSVIHWKENHYAAILRKEGDLYWVADPTFGLANLLSKDVIKAEASGCFLIPSAQMSSSWQRMASAETDLVWGKGNKNRLPDKADENIGKKAMGVCGMPVWSVSDPFMNLWITDEPLGYQPPRGDRISFLLNYKQRDEIFHSTNDFNVGKLWNCDWLTYVEDTGPATADLFVPGGGQRSYITDSNTLEFTSITRMARFTNKFEVRYPSGAIDVYGYRSPVLTPTTYFRTLQIDPWSNTNTFVYTTNAGGNVRLAYVIDATSHTNSLFYDITSSAYSTNLVTRVTDGFGRTNVLEYDLSSGHLTNIVDVLGLSNLVAYETNGWITNLTTPYGSTAFHLEGTRNYFVPETNALVERAVLVTHPDASKELFVYRDAWVGDVPGTAENFITNMPASFTNLLCNAFMYYRNSWHWNRQQFPWIRTIAQTNFQALNSNDCSVATLRNWLHWSQDGSTNRVGHTLNMMREAALGTNAAVNGQRTWYGYDGKPAVQKAGPDNAINIIAQALPDGDTRYVQYLYNSIGSVTNAIDRGLVNGSVVDRTNVFTYAANKIDLLIVQNAAAQIVSSNIYNSFHQVTTNYNASNEVSIFKYNSNHQLTNISYPTGLTVNYSNDNSGYLVRIIESDGATISRTNHFTWTNGLIHTHTDERGSITTNTWDALQRLTSMSNALGAISFVYSNLDLSAVKDFENHWTYFVYDGLRRLTSVTNANGQVTAYSYCGCGSVATVSNAAGIITYNYDLNGRLTSVVYPNSEGSISYAYDKVGRLTNVIGPGGVSITNQYSVQGLMIASSNAFGRLFGPGLDILDRVTHFTNANAVVVTNGYDILGRVTHRGYPAIGSGEDFDYTVRGLAQYDGPDSLIRYEWDGEGRLLSIINNSLRNEFEYDRSGLRTNLLDANNNATIWKFDLYGRVTNKTDALGNAIITNLFDADGRVTNRWTAAKGTTIYRYDAVGNVTNVDYGGATPDVVLQYDALNRLTNVTKGGLVSSFTYTSHGTLASENGPWDSDTIAFSYSNLRKTGFTAQHPNNGGWTESYDYDGAGRLTNVTSGAGGFGFTYDTTHPLLVKKASLPNGSYVTNAYDSMARMTNTWLKNSGGTVLNSHGYELDDRGRRTRQVRTGGDYVDYSYDKERLTSALGKESGGSTRLNEQLWYVYDSAGNLKRRTNNAFAQVFTVTAVNQLSNSTRSGTLTVAGWTTTAATNVSVRSASATNNASLYADKTFAATNFSLVDGSNTFTAVASGTNRTSTNALTMNLPANVLYQYDLNGNLTNDGTRVFFYDDENQLTNVFATNAWKVDFAYDGLGRKRVQKDYEWRNSSWVFTNETRYVYDGWLIVQERDQNNLVKVSYTHGNDLSRTRQGAGGIGGYLARTDHRLQRTDFYHADGNGNITAMVDSLQQVVAQATYEPYGGFIERSGSMADVNSIWYSSKEHIEGPNLYYYGRRFYDPNFQRWINRDPAAEDGGVNLYGFNYVDPINMVDGDGENPLFVAAGIGAVVGGGIGALSAYVNGASGADIARAAVAGATAGAVAGLTGTWVYGAAAAGGASAAGAGAVGGLFGSVAGQTAEIAMGNRGRLSPSEAAAGAGLGGLAGRLSRLPLRGPTPCPTSVPKAPRASSTPNSPTPVPPPARFSGTPGETVRGVDPRSFMSGNRTTVERARLNLQDDLLGRYQERWTPIRVTPDGIAIDGRHALKAASLRERTVTVEVVVPLDPPPTGIPIGDLPITF
jgi:RHS repeat-associated protein